MVITGRNNHLVQPPLCFLVYHIYIFFVFSDCPNLYAFAVVVQTFVLPTGSEERGVLGDRSTAVAILPCYQDNKSMALQLHKHK